MEGDRISYHEPVRRVYHRIKEDGMDNIWDRFEAQGMAGDPDRRCPFCSEVFAVTSAPTDHAAPMPPKTKKAFAYLATLSEIVKDKFDL